MNTPWSYEEQYQKLLKKLVETDLPWKPTRPGVRTRSLIGQTLDLDLTQSFPILTGKKIHWKSVTGELAWMISGSTNVKDLHRYGVHIWDEWADEYGNLGPTYGSQWRGPVTAARIVINDQLGWTINNIKRDPFNRRHLVVSWNVQQLEYMRLPPCHYAFQFVVEPDALGNPSDLHCIVTMRSSDVFLGLPFNMAQYALLTHIVAHLTGLKPVRVFFTLADAHLYENHLDQAVEYLAQDLQMPTQLIPLPAELMDIDAFTPDMAVLENYRHGPYISAPVAV